MNVKYKHQHGRTHGLLCLVSVAVDWFCVYPINFVSRDDGEMCECYDECFHTGFIVITEIKGKEEQTQILAFSK